MASENRIVKSIYVRKKDDVTPVATFTNDGVETSVESRKELMGNPTVSLEQNKDGVFSFEMLVASEKWQLIKDPTNLFEVDGRVYCPLNEEAITYGSEGKDGRIATVTAPERQKLLDRKFVQAYNVMKYQKCKAVASAACVAYDTYEQRAATATFTISAGVEGYDQAMLWDVKDTIYVVDPSDTWVDPPTYINPLSITKTASSITITFDNLGGAIAAGAVAMFGCGVEAIDDHSVVILPRANKKYKLTIDGVQYEDSIVRDARGVLLPRGSGGYALWAILRNTDWSLGVCDMLHADFNTAQVDGVGNAAVADYTALYATFKEVSGSWVADKSQNEDAAFKRETAWTVGTTIYTADISTNTETGNPGWSNPAQAVTISYINATSKRITFKFSNTGGAISNDCVVAFGSVGTAKVATFTVPQTDPDFSLARNWEVGISVGISNVTGWADYPTSVKLTSVQVVGGGLQLSFLNLGGAISSGARARFIGGNDVGAFNVETDMKPVRDVIDAIRDLYGGVLEFDSKRKVINYRDEEKEGSDFNTFCGYEIRKGKNTTEPASVVWDTRIITRLYPLGNGNLNIKAVNNNKAYLDNFSYTDQVFEAYAEQKNISDTNSTQGQTQLKVWGERELSKVCKPRKTVSYDSGIIDRRNVKGYEHEVFDLNSVVRAYYVDTESGEEVFDTLRVVKWTYNVWQPMGTTQVDVGDIHANVQDVFKLLYNKTEEMPKLDASGRISADDIYVPDYYSEYGEYGGGGGGGGGSGGGTLSDQLKEIIESNAQFYVEFDKTHALIGMEAYYMRQFEGETRESFGNVELEMTEQAARFTAAIQHNYETLDGQIRTTAAGLQADVDDNRAQIEMVASYADSINSSLVSFKAYADGKYATATMLAQYQSDTNRNIASVRAYADDKYAEILLKVNRQELRIDDMATWAENFVAQTIEAGQRLLCYGNTELMGNLYVRGGVSLGGNQLSWITLSYVTSLNYSQKYFIGGVGSSSMTVVTNVYVTRGTVNGKSVVTDVTVSRGSAVSSVWGSNGGYAHFINSTNRITSPSLLGHG